MDFFKAFKGTAKPKEETLAVETQYQRIERLYNEAQAESIAEAARIKSAKDAEDWQISYDVNKRGGLVTDTDAFGNISISMVY